MQSLVIYLFAVAFAVSTVLPSGTCCTFGGAVSCHMTANDASSAAQAPPSCCHRSGNALPGEAPSGMSEPGPAAPGYSCCCQPTEATPTTQVVLPTSGDEGTPLGTVTISTDSLWTPAQVAWEDARHPTGPPLRVLLCVWRC